MSASNSRTTRKMLWLAVASFGFAFAMVPMYNIACEKVFGVKLSNTASAAPSLKSSDIDEQRSVQVFFDGTVNSKLPWQFKPQQASMSVVPGKLYEASYWAKNTADFATVANAAPSITPNQFSSYFSKTECFCFTEQALQPGEQKVLPVRFMVSPDLPKEIKTITLSYTFFINGAATAQLNAKAVPNATQLAP